MFGLCSFPFSSLSKIDISENLRFHARQGRKIARARMPSRTPSNGLETATEEKGPSLSGGPCEFDLRIYDVSLLARK